MAKRPIVLLIKLIDCYVIVTEQQAYLKEHYKKPFILVMNPFLRTWSYPLHYRRYNRVLLYKTLLSLPQVFGYCMMVPTSNIRNAGESVQSAPEQPDVG